MGIFIVIEGIDGSGKSTLAKRLCESLKNVGKATSLYREPTDYPSGKYLREFLTGKIELNRDEQLEAFINDRKESVKLNILPSLARNEIVILDRYFYSTAAYQGNEQLSPKHILAMNVKEGFPIPDFLFYLEIDPTIALNRIQSSRSSMDRFETLDKLKAIEKNYNEILPNFAVRLDAELKTEDNIKNILSKLYL
ncbi:dTMP kinase [Leptospira sp. GIMC2001]|uniref:dTMP kinase n=1 Tax=Leptospira sp. GIMC2001 TaxID=1513297 RepID=UPI0023492FF5|nr:dTMP kinase [Leptospira sp. GIMC2001]WCL48352.1 dTMP kinase [Leptospira sp. GIMC2001]